MQISTPAPAYDVVIIGGGMVGASFASALSHISNNSELSILIVEAFAPGNSDQQATNFDARSTALSFGSSQIYDEIGLWPQLSESATAITEIQISDKGRFGATRITSAEQQVAALGYVVENQHIGNCLHANLLSLDKLEFFCPASVESIKPTASGMTLALAAGTGKHSVTAKLVVLADGGKSGVCNQLGIRISEAAYEQQAMIANISFEQPHNNIAYERFTDTGPLAILPLASISEQNRGSLVWTLASEQVAEFMSLPEPELLARLHARFGNRLGKIKHIGERSCYPLSLAVATEQVRPGLVLLGNVAHTLHPVAGQGLNLALRDAMKLASVLCEANAQGLNPGSAQVLQRYAQAQRNDQNQAISFTDYTTRLFSSNNSVKVLVRKFGLLTLELLPAVRREFAKQAMGTASRHAH